MMALNSCQKYNNNAAYRLTKGVGVGTGGYHPSRIFVLLFADAYLFVGVFCFVLFVCFCFRFACLTL